MCTRFEGAAKRIKPVMCARFEGAAARVRAGVTHRTGGALSVHSQRSLVYQT